MANVRSEFQGEQTSTISQTIAFAHVLFRQTCELILLHLSGHLPINPEMMLMISAMMVVL